MNHLKIVNGGIKRYPDQRMYQNTNLFSFWCQKVAERSRESMIKENLATVSPIPKLGVVFA